MLKEMIIKVICILLLGCESVSENVPDKTIIESHTDKTIIESHTNKPLNLILGASVTNDCDYYNNFPLIISSEFSNSKIKIIREAALLWENGLGIELGSLPVSEAPCTQDNPIHGCIVLLPYYIERDYWGGQIEIYSEVIEYSKRWNDLKYIAAHEIGHYLGIKHTSSGLMNEKAETKFELTEVDINAYSNVCME
jgi:hypothetical protein